MAGGGFVAESSVKQYEGRVTAYVIISCIVAATGGLMFGYDIGISGKSRCGLREPRGARKRA